MKANKKRKDILAWIVAIVMIFQMIAPVMAEAVDLNNNEKSDKGLKVNVEIDKEEERATVNWEINFDSRDSSKSYTDQVDFSLEEEVSGILETIDEGPVGQYTISEDGEITFELDERFYEAEEELEKVTPEPIIAPQEVILEAPPVDENLEEKEAEDEELIEEEEPNTEEELDTEEEPDTEEKLDLEEEPKTEDANLEEETNSEDAIIETRKLVGSNKFTLVASQEDIEGLVIKQNPEEEQEPQSYSFSGSFDVDNIILLPEISLLAVDPKDLGNIFTLLSLKINGVEATDDQVVEINDGTTVTLDYTWNTIGKDVNPGDFSQIQVPDTFKLDRNFQDKDIELNNGIVVGTYSLINNMLRFEFNEGIREAGVVENGIVGFGVKFNVEKFQEDVVEEISFNDLGGKTIRIIGKPTITISSISKRGRADSNQDAKEITWTIDVGNPSGNEILNPKLTDIIPEGLEFEAASVKVYELIVGLSGDVSQGAEVQLSSQIVGQNFEINFDSMKAYKGYRVEYTTKITDYSKTKFTNNAVLTYDDKNLPAKATVNLQKSGSIEKDGEYIGNDTIQWWIDVNKSRGSINEAIVRDTLPTGLTLTPNSIEIFKLTQNAGDWSESPSDKTATEFPINLGSLEPSHAYRIKFKTKIDYSIVNGGNYQKTNKFTNKTILYDGEVEIEEDQKTVTVTRASILEKTGNYSGFNSGSDTPKLNWKITVNKANDSIENAIVKDRLPAGLTIDKADIVVKNSAGTDVTANVTITVPANDGSSATDITINLGNINESYTIEYTTKIIDFSIDTFRNSVSLEGTGGTPIVKPISPPKTIYTKSFNGINYNEKTMDWKISLDPKREAISELTITDSFPNKGLILLANTLKVKVGSTLLVEGIDYTLSPNTENGVTGYEKGFILVFGESANSLPINRKLEINYTTSYNPEAGIDPNTANGLHINRVLFTGKTKSGKSINIKREDYKQVNPQTVNSGNKLGRLKSIDESGKLVDGWVSGNERKLQWQININYQKQNLGQGVYIKDRLSYDGQIDFETIKVSKYTVKTNGSIVIGDEIDSSLYTPVLDPDGKGLTINFNTSLDERYIIEFTTSVADISEATYTNTATLQVGEKEFVYEATVKYDKSGKNLSKKSLNTSGTVYQDDEIDWKVKINEALSSIEKDVKLVDTISKGLVFKEDTLKLYKLQGTNRVLVDPESDQGYTIEVENLESGQTRVTILFKGSINSAYEIEYTTLVTAVDGTVNNSVEYSGTNLEITKVETEELRARQFSYVGGDPSKGRILISKTDEDGKRITSGEATFEIRDSEENLVPGGPFKTQGGKVEIVNLALNKTYFIIELEAPQGYVASGQPIEVIVTKPAGQGPDFPGSYEVDVANKKIRGNIELKKVNESRQALAAAEFSLYGELDLEFEDALDLVISDSNGKVLFENVLYGRYIIKETKAPVGYLINKTEYRVEVREDGLTVVQAMDEKDLIVENIREENPPTPPTPPTPTPTPPTPTPGPEPTPPRRPDSRPEPEEPTIIDEEIPQAPVEIQEPEEVPEIPIEEIIETPEEVVIVEEDIPEAVPVPEPVPVERLARTGAIEDRIFYGVGLLLILAGLFISRKKLVK